MIKNYYCEYDDIHEGIAITADEVIIEDNKNINTKLVDQYGRPIFRLIDKIKFGFTK